MGTWVYRLGNIGDMGVGTCEPEVSSIFKNVSSADCFSINLREVSHMSIKNKRNQQYVIIPGNFQLFDAVPTPVHANSMER